MPRCSWCDEEMDARDSELHRPELCRDRLRSRLAKIIVGLKAGLAKAKESPAFQTMEAFRVENETLKSKLADSEVARAEMGEKIDKFSRLLSESEKKAASWQKAAIAAGDRADQTEKENARLKRELELADKLAEAAEEERRGIACSDDCDGGRSMECYGCERRIKGAIAAYLAARQSPAPAKCAKCGGSKEITVPCPTFPQCAVHRAPCHECGGDRK